ncbi:MAG: hypothetical protein HY815_05775 [Candidatus Riflebacteria bacterium]|nr:hypothetical protein [Candidatus Riflebacteria bacterium]
MTIMMILLAAGTAGLTTGMARLRQEAEAERLVTCLRMVREMARSQGGWIVPPNQNSGFGVFFLKNPKADTCFQYFPYVPVTPSLPDDPGNAFSGLQAMGTGQRPITLGLRSTLDLTDMSGAQLASGFQIYFQSDQPGAPDLFPPGARAFPLPAQLTPPTIPDPMGPIPTWNVARVVFWPPGFPPTMPNHSVFNAFPTPINQEGVSVPHRFVFGIGWVFYNRIYIRSPSDHPNDPDPTQVRLPARIRIDLGTGNVRLMSAIERRVDGTW